ncbi:DUF4214 domain-containing protein [Tritonibacter mobilis]|nr:DUF4214 domain-containing protein [Tritonibacter mobilis]
MAISAEDKNFLVSLYVGYFNRAPDPAGLQFWIDQVEAGRDTNTIAADFAASPEAKSLYPFLTTPDVSSPTSFITAVYANLFNRAPDAAGQAFWEAQLSSGAVSPADAIDAIIKGATTAPDSTVLSNKIVVGLDFATDAGNTPGFTFDLNGASGNAAKDAISGVTEDAATVTAAQAATDAYLSGASNPGQSFTLTTGVDSTSGGAGNDTFIGGALAPDGVTAATTLNALDNIDGGAGTDTLRLDTTGNQNQSIQGTITGVENLEYIGSGAAIGTVDATNFSNKIEFQQTADTTLSVSNATGQTLELDRVANATTLTAGYAAAQASAELTSSAVVGSATFSISGTGLKTATLNIDKTATKSSVTVTDTGNTTETFNVASSGASTVVLNSTAAKSVAVSGAGAVNLTTGTAPTTSVDASASTGGLTLATALANTASFTGGSGNDTVTVGANTKAIAMGDGDDSLTWTAAALGSGGSADGGAGTDTVTLSAANAATATSNATLGAAFQNSISNFEVFGIQDTAGAVTVDATYLDGMTTISSAGTTGGALTLNNLAANSTLIVTGAAANAINANLKTATGTDDVLNLSFKATDGFTSAGAIVAPGVETLNITTDDTDTTAPTTVFTAPITAAAVKSVTVSGDVGIDLSTGLGATTLTSFDASGVTATGAVGAVSLTTGAVTDNLTVKGGAGNDVLNAAAAATTGKTVTIDGNGGNDTITGSSTLANTLNGGDGNDIITGGSAVDTIDGGAGDDVITSGNGLDMITTGAGNDRVVVSTNTNGNIYQTVTDASVGDILDFAGGAAGAFNSTAITLGGTAVFQDYLDAAAAGNATDDVSWFQFGGDTYAVQDNAAGATFTGGTDLVVKLVGAVDLSNATIDGAGTNYLTLA